MLSGFFYLFHCTTFRLGTFLHHWYVKSMRLYWDAVLNHTSSIDYYLAWRITARNLLTPLYGDYSFLGYLVSIPLRIVRPIAGAVVYCFVFMIAAAIYLTWLAIPVYALVRVITG
jgi:hypothetical protein